MGSTYLELTNRVLRRLNEVELDASTFSDCKGVHAAAKDAVLDTVRDINSQKFEWPFNLATDTAVVAIGDVSVDFPDNYRIADWESFYVEKDDVLGVTTIPLRVINKDEWYKYGRRKDFDADDTVGLDAPKCVFDLGESFGFTPMADAAYTIKYSYWIRTIDLVLHSDTTTIPIEYNQVITDGAINLLYMFLDNDERAIVAAAAYKKGLSYMSYVLIPKDAYAYDRVIFPSTYGSRKMWTGY